MGGAFIYSRTDETTEEFALLEVKYDMVVLYTLFDSIRYISSLPTYVWLVVLAAIGRVTGVGSGYPALYMGRAVICSSTDEKTEYETVRSNSHPIASWKRVKACNANRKGSTTTPRDSCQEKHSK